MPACTQACRPGCPETSGVYVQAFGNECSPTFSGAHVQASATVTIESWATNGDKLAERTVTAERNGSAIYITVTDPLNPSGDDSDTYSLEESTPVGIDTYGLPDEWTWPGFPLPRDLQGLGLEYTSPSYYYESATGVGTHLLAIDAEDNLILKMTIAHTVTYDASQSCT